MASTKTYVVTAPLVVVKDKEGHDRYLYKGAELPSDVDAEHRRQLVAEKLVEEAQQEETTSEEASSSSTSTRSRSGS